MSNYYKLGLQVGRKKRRGEYWLCDIPLMTLEQTAEFNLGFDRGESEPSLTAKLFVAALGIIVVLAIIGS
jgi:hypothetical protein